LRSSPAARRTKSVQPDVGSTAVLGKVNLVECPQTAVSPRFEEVAQLFGHSLAALEGRSGPAVGTRGRAE
jgi:hypothetical protein